MLNKNYSLNSNDSNYLKIPLAILLRQTTASSHAEIENLPLMQSLLSSTVTSQDYAEYLTRLLNIYLHLETSLYEGLDSNLRNFLSIRPKLWALIYDLTEISVINQAFIKTHSAFQDRLKSSIIFKNRIFLTTSGCIGGLYVLEGATLGGHTIARHLRHVLKNQAGEMHLLDFHGEHTAEAWKRFTTALEALQIKHLICLEEVINGAHGAFACFKHSLSDVCLDCTSNLIE